MSTDLQALGRTIRAEVIGAERSDIEALARHY